MPILLRTQVERTAKTPVTARRARVGGLCRFRRPAERVPAGSPKTGRCADVRENRKFDQNPAQRVRSKEEMRRNGRDLPLAANAGTRRNGQNREILDAAARKQEKAKVSCAHLGEHICPQCGQFGTFTQGLLRGQKQPHWGRKRK